MNWGRGSASADRSAPTPSAATGRFDANDVSDGKMPAALSGQTGFFSGVCDPHPGLTCRAFVSSFEAVRAKSSAVGKQRELDGGEHLDLAHQAVAAVVLPFSARVIAIGISAQAQWIGILERLNGRVERVRHVRLDT